VRQPALQIGRTAAALLLEEIAQPDAHAHQQVMFRPELVARRSTGS
jgi:LacI family transcriptional regulator